MNKPTNRMQMDATLSHLIESNGADNTLWAFVRTLSTDEYDEFLSDLCWSLGEDYGEEE